MLLLGVAVAVGVDQRGKCGTPGRDGNPPGVLTAPFRWMDGKGKEIIHPESGQRVVRVRIHVCSVLYVHVYKP